MQKMVGKTVFVMRCGVLAIAGTLMIGACSGSGAEPTTSTPPTTEAATSTTIGATTTTTTTSTSTTTEAPTSTTAAPSARPDKLVSNFDRDSIDDFDTSGENLWVVVMELDDLFNYLEGNPLEDPAVMVDLVFESSYPYRQQILHDFAELTDNDWHYVDAGVRTVAVDVLEVEAEHAVVKIADMRGEQQIADENGNIVRTYDGWDLDAAVFTLRRGDDNRWRYADVGEFLPISGDELARMVPVEWTGRTP